MRFSAVAVAALVSGAVASPVATPTATQSDPADVYKAQATAKTESPTSKVKGKAFDRYVSIVCFISLHSERDSNKFHSGLRTLIMTRQLPIVSLRFSCMSSMLLTNHSQLPILRQEGYHTVQQCLLNPSK